MVSHARGPEFESASGLHPPCWRNLAWSYTSRLGPVARRQVSSCLTVSLDTGLSHIKPGISIDDAFYPWWDLDVLSNERRLAGDCRCRYDSRAAEDVLGVVGCSNQNISTCPLSGPRSFNVNPCHIPPETDKNWGCKWSNLNPPGTETPLSHPYWKLEEFPFSHY